MAYPIEDIESTISTGYRTIQGANMANAEHRQADALRGIGYLLTAWLMLETRKQERREDGYQDG